MKNLFKNIWLVLGTAAILWIGLENFVIEKVEKNNAKELRHRYNMVFGSAETEAMQSVENYIFTGEGRNKALMVDIIGELETVTNHID